MTLVSSELPTRITAADIGEFPMSAEFCSAAPATFDQLPDHFYDYHMRRFPFQISKMGYNRINEEIEYFEQAEGQMAAIFASFLGSVALDARRLAAAQGLAAADLRAKVHTPDPVREHRMAGGIHTDFRDAFSTLEVRYIVSNHTPTVVPEMPTHAPGRIARLVHNVTPHMRPEVYTDKDRPRVLLSVDI